MISYGNFLSLGTVVVFVTTATFGCNDDGGGADAAAETPPVTTVFGFGRAATDQDIAALDIDVMPDGTGLPAGMGTVAAGEILYRTKCVACHGPTGTEGPWDVLVGRVPGDEFPFGDGRGAPLTIGSYWPYAPPLFDYIRRSMPFDAPGSLSDADVYSLVALLLHWNDLLEADVVLDAEVLSNIEMPARDRFVMDDRVGGAKIR